VGFGLYIHWPYCRRICPYCDFNIYRARALDETAWRQAFLAGLDHALRLVGPRPLRSISFGGGTPSLMPPSLVAAIIERAALRFGLEDDAEIALEANPGSADAARFADLRAAGVNRLSLGIQSFDDGALSALGRDHDAAAARAALTQAQAIFPRVSFDLIYGLPGQSRADWRRALDVALACQSGHLSLYQLTIEPGTAFARAAARGRLALPDEQRRADLYDVAQERCAGAGLDAYEVSNHAAPGHESRHNLIYWRSGDWIGLGPGAHSRLTLDRRRLALTEHRRPEIWLDAVARARSGEVECETLSPAQHASEILLSGLRLGEGIALKRAEDALGAPLGAFLDQARLATLVAAGLVQGDAERLRVTATGRRVLDAVLAELLA